MKSEDVYIPMPDEAAAIIAKTPSAKGATFLRTVRGKAFKAASFGNWFREACHAAGLQGLVLTACASTLPETSQSATQTDRQLMATFGWSTPK